MKDKLNYYYGPYEKDTEKPYKHKKKVAKTVTDDKKLNNS